MGFVTSGKGYVVRRHTTPPTQFPREKQLAMNVYIKEPPTHGKVRAIKMFTHCSAAILLRLSPKVTWACALIGILALQVLLKTTLGDMDVELWSRETPLACRNFVQLCLEQYYDGTIFHRVIKGKPLQLTQPSGLSEIYTINI